MTYARSQTGQWGVHYAGAFPFINLVKGSWGDESGRWTTGGGQPAMTYAQVGSLGFPTTLGGATSRFRYILDVPAGNYVFRWAGGTSSSAGTISSSTPGTWGPAAGGRVPFTYPGGRLDVHITAGPAQFTEFAIVMAADETDYLAGKIVGTRFKERFKEGGFGILRFMDWLNTNSGDGYRYYADYCPENYATYIDLRYTPAAVPAGTTTLSSAQHFAVTTSGPTWTLADKAMFQVTWGSTPANSAFFLRVNGGPEKPVANNHGLTYITIDTGTGQDAYPSYLQPFPVAGDVDWLMYDATLDQYLVVTNGGHHAIVPPSICVKYVNELSDYCGWNVRPWINIPHFALDPLTTLIDGVVAECQANLKVGVKPIFEVSNEVWNNVFNSTRYAWMKEGARGYGDYGHHYWYGRVLAKLGKQISVLYGGDGVGGSSSTLTALSKYTLVCGVQAYGDPLFGEFDERLKSTRLIAEGGGAVSTDAARYFCHRVSPANYWNPPDQDQPQEKTWADAWAGYTEPQRLAAAHNYVQNFIDGATSASIGSGGLPSLLTRLGSWNTFAQTNGVGEMAAGPLRVMCYEGGYSPDYGPDANVNVFRGAVKTYADNMKEATRLLYNGMLARGAEAPSNYVMAGTTNVWPLLDPSVYSTSTWGQFEGIKEFNAIGAGQLMRLKWA